MGLWHDRDWLEGQYIGNGLSVREVARLAGCSHVTILNQLKKFGILARDVRDSCAIRCDSSLSHWDKEWLSGQISSGSTNEQIAIFCNVTIETITNWRERFGLVRKPYRDILWLWQRYFCDGMSITEMAKVAGVTEDTIQRYLQEAGFYMGRVSMRPSAEALSFLHRQLGDKQAVAGYLGVSFQTLAEWCEELDITWCVPQELQDKDWLYQQYIVYGRSATSIARNLGCGYNTVVVWLEKHRIPIRTKEEAQKVCGKRFRGENNPGYIDGRHDLPYNSGFKKVISSRVLERDSRACQLCGATDCLLHCHHIDFDKTNDDELNLIALCPVCHNGKAHGKHKTYWQAVLTEYQVARFVSSD